MGPLRFESEGARDESRPKFPESVTTSEVLCPFP